MDAIAHFGGRLPVLGVCLGHQCHRRRRSAAGAPRRAPVHGKTDRVHHDGRTLFAGCPSPFTATRYHSLVVDRAAARRSSSAPGTTTAWSWACATASCPCEGVQFHPESVLTERGRGPDAQLPRRLDGEASGHDAQ